MNGDQLKEWFLSINFNPYELPSDETFNLLCVGKSGPLWYEIVQKCQNHEKIHQIKSNILYHSLKNDPEDPTTFRPKAVRLLHEKKELLNKLDSVRSKIRNTEKNLETELYQSKLNKFREYKLKQENDILMKKLFLCKEKAELAENLIKNYREKQKTISDLIRSSENLDDQTNFAKKSNATALFKCSLNPGEVEARIQSVFNVLDGMDTESKLEINTKQNENDSFKICNNLFFDTNINDCKIKLLPTLKEKFKMSDLTLVFEILIKMQKSILDQFHQYRDNIKTGDMKSYCNIEHLLAKMYAIYNKICLNTAILQDETQKYDKYIDDYLSKIKNPKELEFKTLYYNYIGFKATKDFLNDEFSRMQKSFEINNSMKNLEIVQNLTKFQNNIEHNKQLIEKHYPEIVPIIEDINQVQQNLSKNHSLLVFNVNNVISQIDDHSKNHQEIAEFKLYPLEFNEKSFFNIENTWNVFLKSSHNYSEEVAIKILDNPWLRPETQLIRIFNTKLTIMCLNGLSHQGDFQNCFSIIFPNNIDKRKEDAKNSLEKIASKCHSVQLMIPELEKSLEFCVKQPWKNVISESRLFNGENYKYYEKKFETMYKSIKEIDKNQFSNFKYNIF